MKCQICKKEIEKTKFNPIIDKKVIPICSKDCFNKYLECWKDENNFPNNLKDIKNSPKEIEEYPDY